MDETTSDEEQLTVDVHRGIDGTTVSLRGELDVQTWPDLWRALDLLEPSTLVTLDVSGLDFVDSTGIGCLFKLHRRVADAGGMVVMRGATPAVRRLMETVGLHRSIAILPG